MTQTSRRKLSHPFDWQKQLFQFVLGIIAATGVWYLSLPANKQITIAVPSRDLPIYHLITNPDLTTISIPSAELSSEALGSDTELVNHYTLEPLTAGKVVLTTQLVPSADPALNINTTTISIPATEAMALGGRLSSGDIIMLWESPNNSTTSTATLLLDQVLVLDVLPVGSPMPTGDPETLPYVVILAVPVNRQADILGFAAKGSLMFTLRP